MHLLLSKERLAASDSQRQQENELYITGHMYLVSWARPLCSAAERVAAQRFLQTWGHPVGQPPLQHSQCCSIAHTILMVLCWGTLGTFDPV